MAEEKKKGKQPAHETLPDTLKEVVEQLLDATKDPIVVAMGSKEIQTTRLEGCIVALLAVILETEFPDQHMETIRRSVLDAQASYGDREEKIVSLFAQVVADLAIRDKGEVKKT